MIGNTELREAEAFGVSAAIICRNEASALPRALNSLLPSGELSFPWEILIVDNESTDETAKVLADFSSRNKLIDLRHIMNSPNHLGLARRRAVSLAKYSIIAFIDADCVAPPNWIKSGADAFRGLAEKEPNLLAIGSGNLVPESEGGFYAALAITLSSFFGGMNAVQAKSPTALRSINHLPTCNVFYLKEKALALGNFSGDFPDVCEDLEFSWRAIRQGYKLVFIPGLEVIHHHRESIAYWAKKMFRYGRGQLRIARLYPGHLLGVKGLPLLLIFSTLIGLVFYPRVVILLLFLYLGFLLLYSIALCASRRRIQLAPQVFLLFLVTQFFYGAGEFWGIYQLGEKKYGKVNQ